MKQMNWLFTFLLLLACGHGALAQTAAAQQSNDNGAATLDAQREKRALQIFLKSVQTEIVAAAEDMPAYKYSFAPTEGEFKGVRTFAQQVKHLSATNHPGRCRPGRGPASRCRRRKWP
jgi:hypothetical protein